MSVVKNTWTAAVVGLVLSAPVTAAAQLLIVAAGVG